MMRLLFCCCVIWIFGACKEKYEPPISSPAAGYLVIEGFISPSGSAELHLTRSIPLNDSARQINEPSAQVALEGTDGSRHPLAEIAAGTYTREHLNLDGNVQYRLFIRAGGKDYATEFLPVRHAPPIDSVSWKLDEDGMRISINTHDPQNKTWYYRWETEETWEFTSLVTSVLEHDIHPTTGEIIGVKYRFPDQSPDWSIYTCWQHENSKHLLLGTSEKLSEDRIQLPLVFIPSRSWKLSVLYSIKIKQYALTKAEYNYLQIMKRNSETTGSIFDPQPSQLRGNIRCLTNPDEPVIGYVGLADMQEKRIFIKRSEVPGWNYALPCQSVEIPTDSAWAYPGMAPIAPWSINDQGKITEYTAAEWHCIDCTLRGTNVKPPFWP